LNKVTSYKRKEKVQELYQTLLKTALKDPSKAHYSTVTPTLDYTTMIKCTNYSSLELVGLFTMNGEGGVTLYLLGRWRSATLAIHVNFIFEPLYPPPSNRHKSKG
jgi:hypothetical protein